MPSPQRMPFPFPFPGMPRAGAGAAGFAPPIITAQAVTPNTGNPTPAHLRYAEDLRGRIPTSLQTAARDALGATTIVYALLLSDDEAVRNKQLQALAAITSPAICQETMRVWPEAQAVATHAKLPLVDLAMPGLRHMSPGQFQQFRTAVQKLVESDGEIDLFEYVLQKIVLRHLEPHYDRPASRSSSITRSSRCCRIARCCSRRWHTSGRMSRTRSSSPSSRAPSR